MKEGDWVITPHGTGRIEWVQIRGEWIFGRRRRYGYAKVRYPAGNTQVWDTAKIKPHPNPPPIGSTPDQPVT